jgi:hypothetical protein
MEGYGVIDKEFVKPFLDKFVGITYTESNGQPFFSKGTIIRLSDNSLVLRYKGLDTILSFDCIQKIRVIGGEQ